MKIANRTYPKLLLPLLIGASLAFLAQKPGSEENPLITLKYAQHLYAFQIYSFPSPTTLRLQAGTELVLRTGRAKLKSRLLDLTQGKDLSAGLLLPNHHYLSMRSSLVQLTTPAILLIKGKWNE